MLPNVGSSLGFGLELCDSKSYFLDFLDFWILITRWSGGIRLNLLVVFEHCCNLQQNSDKNGRIANTSFAKKFLPSLLPSMLTKWLSRAKSVPAQCGTNTRPIKALRCHSADLRCLGYTNFQIITWPCNLKGKHWGHKRDGSWPAQSEGECSIYWTQTERVYYAADQGCDAHNTSGVMHIQHTISYSQLHLHFKVKWLFDLADEEYSRDHSSPGEPFFMSRDAKWSAK